MVSDAIKAIDIFSVRIPQDDSYLGGLGPGEKINERGYVVRRGNRTIYPQTMRSAVIRVTLESGAEGWGKPMAWWRPMRFTPLSRI